MEFSEIIFITATTLITYAFIFRSVPLFESDPETALLHCTNSDSLSDVELLNYDVASTVSLSSMATSNNQVRLKF